MHNLWLIIINFYFSINTSENQEKGFSLEVFVLLLQEIKNKQIKKNST